MNFRLLLILWLGFSLSAQEADSIVPPPPVAVDTLHSVSSPDENTRYCDPSYFKQVRDLKKANYSEKQLDSLFQAVQNRYSGEEYDYDREKIKNKSFWERLIGWIERLFKKILSPFDNIDRELLYDVLAIIGIALVIFIIYKLIISRSRYRTSFKEDDDEGDELRMVEKNLEEISLDEYLRNAEKEKNYNLAVRYQFLKILQKMAWKKHIKWDYRKTNADFIAEVQNKPFSTEFAEVCKQFEYAWFGDFEITESLYQDLVQVFENFSKQL